MPECAGGAIPLPSRVNGLDIESEILHYRQHTYIGQL